LDDAFGAGNAMFARLGEMLPSTQGGSGSGAMPNGPLFQTAGSAGGGSGTPIPPTTPPASRSAAANSSAGNPTSNSNAPQSLQQQSTSKSASIGQNAEFLKFPNLSAFGIQKHFGGKTTTVDNATDLVPQTFASQILTNDQQDRRPANVVGAFGSKGIAAVTVPGLGASNKIDATGVAGSLSPSVLLGQNSPSNPLQTKQQLSQLKHPAVTHSSTSLVQNQPVVNAASPPPTVAPDANPGGDGGGSGGSGGSGGGSGGTGSSSDTTIVSTTLQGSYTFTLNESGSDSIGNYALLDTGTVTLSFAPDANGNEIGTGSVQISSQLHRGAGSVGSGDPTTTATVTFNPSTGTGLVLGFDIDAYNTTLYSVALGTASTYALTVKGGDTFNETDTETDTENDPTTGENLVDATKVSGQGTETLSFNVTGSGTARSYSYNDASTEPYTGTENSTDATALGTETGKDVFAGSITGNDVFGYQELGTIGAANALQPTSFQSNDKQTV
jgi:hypothetical protein